MLTILALLAVLQLPPVDDAVAQRSQIPGCRLTYWLSEAIVSPQTQVYLVLWNPLHRAQEIELTVFDPLSESPPASLTIAARKRVPLQMFPLRRETTPIAISIEVRWESAGMAHLVTWPLDFAQATIVSPSLPLTVCR